MIDVTKELCSRLQIGRVGENVVTDIQFDFSAWVEKYGAGGNFYLTVRAPKSDTSYPAMVTIDGTVATWSVTSSDLSVVGFGKVEAWYSIGDAVKASTIYDTWVGESLDGEGEVPDPYESWMQEVESYKAGAVAAAESAEQAKLDAQTAQGRAESAQTAAESARDTAVSAKETAVSARDSASNYASNASTSAATATNKAAEALSSANNAAGSATTATDKANEASESALKAEGFAVGEKNGEPAEEGDYYENNARYYAQQASDKADEAAASAASLIVDSELDKTSINPVQNKVITENLGYLNALAITESASGNIASFDDGADGVPMRKLQVSLSPIQEGTGTPSPSNVRPIKGHESVGVTVADDVDDPTESNTYTQDFDVTLTEVSKDNTPYLYRAVGDVGGDRLRQMLVGGTVCWNQLVRGGNFANVDYVNYWSSQLGTISVANNSLTYIATSIGSQYWSNQVGQNLSKIIPANHVVFTHVETYAPYSNAFYMSTRHDNVGMSGGSGISNKTLNPNTWNSFSGIGKPSNSVTDIAFYWSMNTDYQVGDQVQLRNAYIVDLTELFNSTTIADHIYSLEQANAGAGVALFRKLFNKDYYAYNAGELMSVYAVNHKMVGVNQWDEEWEVGAYSDVTGAKVSANNRIRSKNYIPIIPSTLYHGYWGGSAGAVFAFMYDADKNFIGGSTANVSNNNFTTPSNAYYMTIATYNANSNTYNNDICINLSDPAINGTYYPYEKHEYAITPKTLRGKLNLVDGQIVYSGDTLEHDKHTEAWAEVDLGNFTWLKYSDTNNVFVSNSYSSGKKIGNFNLLCSKYPVSSDASVSTMPDKTIKGHATTGNIYIKDSSFATQWTSGDVASFKSAMNGVTLVLEKATPTVTTGDYFEEIQTCNPQGTEYFTTDNDMPVGHETTYLSRAIYGGTLDLVSGLLTVDKLRFLLNGQTSGTRFTEVSQATTADGTKYVAYMPLTSFGMKTDNMALCDSYQFRDTPLGNLHVGEFCAIGSYMRFVIADQTIDTLAKWNAHLALNPIQLVYELAEPQTYQLTPQQINTLLGTNNVWSEQGDVEVRYCADPKLYIDKKIKEAKEEVNEVLNSES